MLTKNVLVATNIVLVEAKVVFVTAKVCACFYLELHEPAKISFTYGSGDSVKNGGGEKYILIKGTG